MLKSIFTTAFRNILRHRSFSLINLIGLSVGMSLGLLIITIIKGQYAFDNFHPSAERIYRVNTRALRTSGGSEDYASAPLPIASALKEDYTFAENVIAINRNLRGDVIYGNVNVPMNGLIVDPAFLEVFNFPLDQGNPATALREGNGIVLTEKMAQKIFGQQEALGQTITMGEYGSFKVSGVLSKFPARTHFEFEALVSTSLLPGFERQGVVRRASDSWNNYYGNYVYFKIKEGREISEAEKALTDITKKYYKGLKLETRDRGYEFFLLPLTKLTPGPLLSNQMGNGMPRILIIMLGSLAAIVMIMACFNYTNLMIAKSLSRAREIGVRKVIGAQRWQVFLQFIGEAVVFSVLALGISYLLLQMLKPAFMQLQITQEFSIDLGEDTLLLFYFILFSIGVGAIAGILPAGYLSAFKPAKVLKDGGSQKIYTRVTLRRALMVMQFTLSLIFIIVVTIIYRQIDYMYTKDYGINDQNILNVRLQGVDFQKLANEVRALPGVVSVGAVSHALGTWADRSSDYNALPGDEPFVMRDFLVDDNYLENIGVKFVAGRNFDPVADDGFEKSVILNEKALKQFSFPDPVSAIGEGIYVDDSTMLKVIGVVRDFHFRPLSYEIGPVAFRYKPESASFLSMQILPGQKESIVAALAPIWKKLDPVHTLEWKMMSEEIDQAYTDAGFTDILKVVGYIAFLALTLACLGMLGMAMYAARTRVKEIGVRKVMGANVADITLLLSRSFMVLIGIAVVIAVPVSVFLGDAFLNIYAYKISITPWLILFGAFVVISLGLVTMASQTVRAALSNPVDALHYE